MLSAFSARKILLPIVVTILVVVGVILYYGFHKRSAVSLPEYGKLPMFSLVDSRGQAVTRETLRGKVWVADLIYTRCPDTCPFQSAEMAKLQKEFAGKPDFRQVSITVDPAFDTAEVLTAYGKKFGADFNRWFFLTGGEKEIARLASEGFHLVNATRTSRAAPFLSYSASRWLTRLREVLSPTLAFAHHPGDAEEEGATGPKLAVDITHSSRFVLVDRTARIRGYYLSGDKPSLKKLRADIRALLGG